MRKRRWSDNQKQFGPFTFSNDGGMRWLAVVVASGDTEDAGCNLRISLLGYSLIVELPALVPPAREWVDTSGYAWSHAEAGYWDTHEREFGFSWAETFLQVFYGQQTDDSSTMKSWGYFLPFMDKRFHRISLYDLNGNHFWTQFERDQTGELMRIYEAQTEAEGQCPSLVFEFLDFDGERLEARTHIEEREWRHGTGWFKWLSWLIPHTVKRSLDIHFSGETGRRKGSWKGGTLGHGIEMLPGELHQSAFERYCQKHGMTFLGIKEAA